MKSQEGLYCTKEQCDGVRNCNHIMPQYYAQRQLSLVTQSVESRRSVVTNDDAETTFLRECVLSYCRKGTCALPVKEDNHYLTHSKTYVVWFGTVDALAQDRRTCIPFASFWKAFPIISFRRLVWYILQHCHQPETCLIWNRWSYRPPPVQSRWEDKEIQWA